MKLFVQRFMNEPAFALGITNAGLQALQVSALSLPGWAHAVIVAAGAIAAAITTRQLVTPAAPRT